MGRWKVFQQIQKEQLNNLRKMVCLSIINIRKSVHKSVKQINHRNTNSEEI